MANKMKYWNGSSWVELDAKNADTLGGNTVAQVRSGTTKADVSLGSVENYGVATQAEAQAGTSNVKYMTPLRTKEEITANEEAVRTASSKPLRLEVVNSVDGQTPTAGRIVFSTAEGKAKVGDGSAWL